MASKRVQRPLKKLETAGEGALRPVPLGALGPLAAERQVLPIFATLDGVPVAVLALDTYRRLVLAALDRTAPQSMAPQKPARKPSARPVSTIERDAEVATLLRELFRKHMTVAQLRAACIERFGEARAPSLTRITIFRQRAR